MVESVIRTSERQSGPQNQNEPNEDGPSAAHHRPGQDAGAFAGVVKLGKTTMGEKSSSNTNGVPKEIVQAFLAQPAKGFDRPLFEGGDTEFGAESKDNNVGIF